MPSQSAARWDPREHLERDVVQAALAVETYERDSAAAEAAYLEACQLAERARERLEASTKALRQHLAGAPAGPAGVDCSQGC